MLPSVCNVLCCEVLEFLGPNFYSQQLCMQYAKVLVSLCWVYSCAAEFEPGCDIYIYPVAGM